MIAPRGLSDNELYPQEFNQHRAIHGKGIYSANTHEIVFVDSEDLGYFPAFCLRPTHGKACLRPQPNAGNQNETM